MEYLAGRTAQPGLHRRAACGRSSAAAEAATRTGYSLCINILEGFEGDKDSASQRNRLGGWRHAGLPWVQS